jgi:hypothetical protein
MEPVLGDFSLVNTERLTTDGPVLTGLNEGDDEEQMSA